MVGKSRNKRTLKNLFDMDFEDKLISLLPSIEIHIIPGNTGKRSYKKPKKRVKHDSFHFSWTDAMKTFTILVAATLLSHGIRRLDIMNQNIIMVYIFSVLLVSRMTEGY